ncbi:MAG: MarR family transcriptional regulator [Beijerinckiaceae bacterium]|nr:MarR family transcriptional regulator [Beijerinckiaceae bacterium]
MDRQRPSTLYLLHQTSQGLRSRLEQALRPLGVTGLQYTILGLLDRHEGLSSADLSRRFFVTQQTMNQVIGGMTKRGLIDRIASEANRRILRMTLTTEGRDLLVRSEVIADAIEAEALDCVPGGDLAQMREHLRFLLRQLRGAGGDDHAVVDQLYEAGLEDAGSGAPADASTRGH